MVKIRVNINKLELLSEEVKEFGSELKKVTSGIEEVKHRLRQQTEFEENISALSKVSDELNIQVFNIKCLAASLQNINALYSDTESNLEQGIEEFSFLNKVGSTGNIDLSNVNKQINKILYGGYESGKT